MKNQCQQCGSRVIKDGKTAAGTQRFRCKNCGLRFSEEPKTSEPLMKNAATLYSSGLSIRDVAHALSTSPQTVVNWLEKLGVSRRSKSFRVSSGLPQQATRPSKAKSPIERFWAKVNRASGNRSPHADGECWEWVGATTPMGYGRFWSGLNYGYAHRYSWELQSGEIPGDMIVMHKCDNPSCVRPNHLKLGTMSENSRDSVKKGRWGNKKRGDVPK